MGPREAFAELEKRVAQDVVGQATLVRQVLIGLLANGHLLLEGLPGLAKTRTVKALARQLDAQMSRIQFTPDLLPSDVTGTEVLHQDGGKNVFQFQPGPIFGNVILADEINRAPAKVQAALLEAMEERQITVAGTTHALPPLFMVLATQNPIEQEGTYPLPEAQLDRFLMKVLVDYPVPDDERSVLELVRSEETAAPEAKGAAAAKIPQQAVLDARAQVSAIHVSEAIERYVIDLVDATRHPQKHGEPLAKWLSIGASPRGGIGLDRCARANAWLEKRDFVTPDDVRAVAAPVLRHRLILGYDASADGVTADQVLEKVLAAVAVPA